MPTVSLALRGIFFTGALAASAPALAFPDQHGCHWQPGAAPSAFAIPIPQPLYLTSNQPNNTVIGTPLNVRGRHASPSVFGCYNRDSLNPIFYNLSAVALTPQATLRGASAASDLPPPEKIRQTSIPGIGATIEWQITWGSDFTISGPAAAPFDGTVRVRYQRAWSRSPGGFWTVTLVKTGPLEPGRYRLEGSDILTRSMLSGPDSTVAQIWDMGIEAEIIVTGCGTAPNPITPNPVELGSHKASDFAQAQYTRAVPFQLNLTGCNAPTDGSMQGVYVQMDPAEGSNVIDADRGLFSLSNSSGAQNVAVQLLHADGLTPYPLARKQLHGPVTDGDMTLGFAARLAKLANPVKPGPVAGALKFTVTYE